jgi:hypothetical protein
MVTRTKRLAALVAVAQVDEPDDAAGPRDEDEAKVISGVC